MARLPSPQRSVWARRRLDVITPTRKNTLCPRASQRRQVGVRSVILSLWQGHRLRCPVHCSGFRSPTAGEVEAYGCLRLWSMASGLAPSPSSRHSRWRQNREEVADEKASQDTAHVATEVHASAVALMGACSRCLAALERYIRSQGACHHALVALVVIGTLLRPTDTTKKTDWNSDLTTDPFPLGNVDFLEGRKTYRITSMVTILAFGLEPRSLCFEFSWIQERTGSHGAGRWGGRLARASGHHAGRLPALTVKVIHRCGRRQNTRSGL